MEPFSPPAASVSTVCAVFVFLLVGFDIVLVRWLKIGKVAWKWVEYVWLGFAMLGILAAVGQVRMTAANAQAATFQTRATMGFFPVRSLVNLLSSDPGPVCRTFVHSQSSPPREVFDATQRDYDSACKWFKAVAKAIPSEMPAPIRPIQPDSLPSRPDVSAVGLGDMIGGFFTQLGYFNEDVRVLDDVLQRTRRSGVEDDLFYLGPFLVALALALRITKVTGEIKLES